MNHWQDLGREEKMAKKRSKTQARYQSLRWSLNMREPSPLYLNLYTNKRSTISVPMNMTRGAGRR